MASEQFSLCWDNFHKNMSSGMNSLLENEDLVDVTLAVQGKCLKAHKMVLSVCSPYFKELFKSNPCQHPIVFMKDVSYEALRDLLQFMYQGEVQVSQENLTTFIKTAEALQIKGLTGDGNGSADTEPEVTQEKPAHKIDEYKPTPRVKKQQPAPVATSPVVKRPRLSVSSTDSQPPSSTTKTEPVPLASIPGLAPEPGVQFKMEPYDQSQSLIDETGDDNFGDDNLDDTNVDDVEDYSMMESEVGGEEPQAGTSTDGAGEGQGNQEYVDRLLTKKKSIIWKLFTPQNEIKATCNLCSHCLSYKSTTSNLKKHIARKHPTVLIQIWDDSQTEDSKSTPAERYLVCSEYKRLVCKARAILPLNGPAERLVLRKEHNHPPQHEASVKEMFVKDIKGSIFAQPDRSLRTIYEDVSFKYPEASAVYPYSKIHPSMRRWRATAWKEKQKY